MLFLIVLLKPRFFCKWSVFVCIRLHARMIQYVGAPMGSRKKTFCSTLPLQEKMLQLQFLEKLQLQRQDSLGFIAFPKSCTCNFSFLALATFFLAWSRLRCWCACAKIMQTTMALGIYVSAAPKTNSPTPKLQGTINWARTVAP